MEMINLCGTTLLGHAKLSEEELEILLKRQGISPVEDFQPYIATKWIVFIIPLIPLKSCIVLGVTHRGDSTYSETEYILQETSLNWAQILRTYAIAYTIAIALFLAIGMYGGYMKW